MEKYAVYVPRLIKKQENFAPGHRACIGCGEALAMRQAFKALDNNVIVVNATGCMEIFASQLPLTSCACPGYIRCSRTQRRWLPASKRLIKP
jgi:pyruvate ferredoxin oxidoreductase beta subunit